VFVQVIPPSSENWRVHSGAPPVSTVTVTGLVYQPLAPVGAAGVTVAVTDSGAVMNYTVRTDTSSWRSSAHSVTKYRSCTPPGSATAPEVNHLYWRLRMLVEPV
jgi:hypothetical protein